MRQIFRWAAALALVMTTAGCGLIRAAVQANYAGELEELEAAGDYEGLDAECRKPRHDKACQARGRVAKKRLEASTCDNLVANTEAYYRRFDATKDDDVALFEKFYGCKLANELFTMYSIRHPSHAWATLDKQGTDVFASLLGHLSSHGDGKAFDGYNGFYAAKAVSKWLVAANDRSRCAPVASHMSHIAPDSRDEMLWFFYEVGCPEQATPMAVDRLTSDDAEQRIQACAVLAKFGDAAVLDRLETLAETDGYKVEREVHTQSGLVGVELFYPVRERCLEAAGKVRLRG